MLEIRGKNKLRKITYSLPTLFLLSIILFLFLKALWGVYIKESVSKDNLNKENLELQRLINRQKTLSESFEYLKTDEGVEKEMRDKFRVAKDGERLAVIIDNNASTTDTNGYIKISLWNRFIGLLGF